MSAEYAGMMFDAQSPACTRGCWACKGLGMIHVIVGWQTCPYCDNDSEGAEDQ